MTFNVGAFGARQFRQHIAALAMEIFQPLPNETVTEWADANRMLPATSPFPGRFRTSRVPYMREIQNALSDEVTPEVVFASSSQVAKSTVGENFIGYLMHRAPCAILMVWPTEEKLKKWSLKRLDPMIEDSAVLAGMFPRTGRRETGDSIAYKEFPGGWLNAITAKSTTALKSDTARVAVAEEVDEWDGDVGGQGDPIDLLMVRLRNFWNSKFYANSTPTFKNGSRIWSLLEHSTWEEFWVPCPHCKDMQVLRWRDVSEGDEEESGAYRFLFERNADGEVIDGSTKYVCVHCAGLVDERWKNWMLQRGEWRARFPGRRRRGFHIWTAYSPLSSWDQIARDFLKAKDSPHKLKVFVNTVLGLPFRDEGEKVSSHFLSKRAEPYPMNAAGELVLPRGVGLLTAGVDVQGDRLELLLCGWGAGEISWVHQWKRLDGDPSRDDVWRELDQLLVRTYPHEDGAQLRIAATAVDAGFQAERVWRFCAARARRKVIATVGRVGGGRKLIEAPGPEKFKKARSQRRPMHILGVDGAKDLLHGRLKITAPTAPGYVHFHTGLDQVFFEQLTAEELRTTWINGRAIRRWELPSGVRNEALDLAVLNMGALAYLGLPVINQLGALAERVTAEGRALTAGAPAPAAARPFKRMLSRGLHEE